MRSACASLITAQSMSHGALLSGGRRDLLIRNILLFNMLRSPTARVGLPESGAPLPSTSVHALAPGLTRTYMFPGFTRTYMFPGFTRTYRCGDVLEPNGVTDLSPEGHAHLLCHSGSHGLKGREGGREKVAGG